MPDLAHLLSELAVGPVTLPNRVVFLPHMTLYGNVDGTASDRHCAYHEERARGGVGLIVTEGQVVHPTGWVTRAVRAYDAAAMASWAPTVEAVHRHGTRFFAQLTHYGNQTFTEFTGLPAWAPSAVPDAAVGHVPKAMTADDIAEVVAGFADAAGHAAEVGFDGVELKLGHDGLLRQFLSPYSNRRTDAYGGDLPGRLRLTLEVLAAVRARVGRTIVVGARLCLDEGFPGGYGLDDGLAAAALLDGTGLVDYFSADLGTWMAPETISPSTELAPGYGLDATAALTGAVGVPVVAFGRIKDPAMAEEVVASGRAHLVGMARQLITDPDWVAKAARGDADRIRPCVACNQICNSRLFRFIPIGCVHNPAAGREERLGHGTLRPAGEVRRVVVVGGGPAGLKAAEVAARRGHRVTLVERADRLGGQVALAASSPAHGEWGQIVTHLVHELDVLGADVRLDVDGDADLIAGLRPDAVVVATGAVPGPPAFAVADGASVLHQWDVLDGGTPHDADVVLYDLGVQFEGPTLAEALAAAGNRVRWVTPAPMVAMSTEMATIAPVRRRLADAGVEIVTEHAVVGVEGGAVSAVNVMTGRPRTLTGIDHVVLAGHKVATGPGAAPGGIESHVIGDAVAPRTVEAAILEGDRVGRSL